MQPIIWRDKAASISLLPERGRVLQVEVNGHNAFWTPHAPTDDWNVGGDRLWVAPEAAWFWKTLERVDFTKYEIPSSLDPGHWKLIRSDDDFCEMSQQTTLHQQHNKQEFAIEVTRRVRRVDLSQEIFAGCIAFHTENELQLGDDLAGEQSFGLWSVLQLPGGGQMSVGVRESVRPRDYFAPIRDDLWSYSDGALHLKITAKDQYKIGVSPSAATGRVVYARPIGDQQLFVAREIWPQPWLPYCDAPLLEPNTQGDAVQIYNDDGSFGSDDGSLGSFGEMEWQSRAIQSGKENQLIASNLTVVGLALQADWTMWRNRWLSGQIAVS